MRMPKGNGPYFLLLFAGVLLTSLAIDAARHLLGPAGAAALPHSHITLEQAAIMTVCLLLYSSEKLRLYHLNFRLCLLSIVLVLARVVYEVHRAGPGRDALLHSALFILLLAVLVFFARHPLLFLRNEGRQSATQV